MASRHDEICDLVVAAAEAWWGPVAPDAVTRDALPEWNTYHEARPAGRKVFVTYADVPTSTPATRAEEFRDYPVQVVIAEGYGGDAADAPNDWLDERDEFAAGLYDRLTDATADPLSPGGPWPQTDGGLPAAGGDAELLRENKVYVAAFTVTYRELT